MNNNDIEQMSRRELIELVKSLMKEIRRLHKELELDHAHKLPDFIKPNTEKKEPAKAGAKEGHEGVTRPMPEKIDEKKSILMKKCPKGHKLKKINETRKRTVEDIELVRKTKVIEYELQGYYCRKCKKKVFPEIFEAMPGFRLGMNFCNYVCERKFGYRMPYNMIQRDLIENFGLKASQATLVNAVHAVSCLLGKKYDEYKKNLLEGRFMHIDETGWRVAGTNLWLWKFKSKDTVVTVVNWKRSRDVPEEIIGKNYKGTMIHDGYAAYNKLEGEHQQCWAHVSRNSRKAVEKCPASEEAKKFHNALKHIYEDATKVRKSKKNRKRFENRMKRLLGKRHRNPEVVKLKKFLTKHFDELFVFVEKYIDGTNNAAERAIRNDVVIRKISGGNRSAKGRHDYEVLSSVIQTCQLRNEDFSDVVMNELITVDDG